MENCFECGMEMDETMTNYGTPEFPICIHCNQDDTATIFDYDDFSRCPDDDEDQIEEDFFNREAGYES